MSNALEQFETSLVRAARALHDDRAAQRSRVDREPAPVAARSRGRVRRRGSRALAAVVLAVVLVAAGHAILGPTGNPKTITQFECGIGGHGNSHGLFTAEPVAACAALWPSLYHRPAPPLVAWVYETGGVTVVRPADQPPTERGWKRLPRGWTADGAVIGLNDQLEDVTTGLPSRACWSATAASQLASALLRADGLSNWHLRISSQPPLAGASARCLSVMQAIGGPQLAPNTVMLVERAVKPLADGSPRYPSRFGRQRRTVENRVNRLLRAGGNCATPAQAIALWRARARAGGIPASADIVQAPTARSGIGMGTACARIFISEPGGGGPADVYAADLP
jgi:hypothetical protein